MKTLYNINKVVFILTLVLYVTLYFGLLSQILLGGIQVLSAAILFFSWKIFNAKTKEYLKLYWVITTLYSICWLFKWESFNDTFIIIFGVIILPMSIAGYFLYILNSIKHIKK